MTLNGDQTQTERPINLESIALAQIDIKFPFDEKPYHMYSGTLFSHKIIFQQSTNLSETNSLTILDFKAFWTAIKAHCLSLELQK